MIIDYLGVCAIVKNEADNLAGGIESYVRSIIPHVKLLVIVDTGSTDNTLHILKSLQSEFSTLYVYTSPFITFSFARNAAMWLSHYTVRKLSLNIKYWMILDADERLFYQDWAYLKYILDYNNFCNKNLGVLDKDDIIDSNYLSDTCSNVSITDNFPINSWDGLNDSDYLDYLKVLSSSPDTIKETDHLSSNPNIELSNLSAKIPYVPHFTRSFSKFRCVNVDQQGLPTSRQNAGLMNPRLYIDNSYTDLLNFVDLSRYNQKNENYSTPTGVSSNIDNIYIKFLSQLHLMKEVIADNELPIPTHLYQNPTSLPSSQIIHSIAFVDMVQAKRFERLVGVSTLLTSVDSNFNSNMKMNPVSLNIAVSAFWVLPKVAYTVSLPNSIPLIRMDPLVLLYKLKDVQKQVNTEIISESTLSFKTLTEVHNNSILVDDTSNNSKHISTKSLSDSPSQFDMLQSKLFTSLDEVNYIKLLEHPHTYTADPLFLHFVPSLTKRKVKNGNYQGKSLFDQLHLKRKEMSEISNLSRETSDRVKWGLVRHLQRVVIFLLRTCEYDRGDDMKEENGQRCRLMKYIKLVIDNIYLNISLKKTMVTSMYDLISRIVNSTIVEDRHDTISTIDLGITSSYQYIKDSKLFAAVNTNTNSTPSSQVIWLSDISCYVKTTNDPHLPIVYDICGSRPMNIQYQKLSSQCLNDYMYKINGYDVGENQMESMCNDCTMPVDIEETCYKWICLDYLYEIACLSFGWNGVMALVWKHKPHYMFLYYDSSQDNLDLSNVKTKVTDNIQVRSYTSFKTVSPIIDLYCFHHQDTPNTCDISDSLIYVVFEWYQKQWHVVKFFSTMEQLVDYLNISNANLNSQTTKNNLTHPTSSLSSSPYLISTSSDFLKSHNINPVNTQLGILMADQIKFQNNIYFNITKQNAIQSQLPPPPDYTIIDIINNLGHLDEVSLKYDSLCYFKNMIIKNIFPPMNILNSPSVFSIVTQDGYIWLYDYKL